MTNILLISEDDIKTNLPISDNVWGDWLRPAIIEAQDMGLQTILGQNLYEAILSKVDDGTISESGNTAYKTLLDGYVQTYLMYQTIANIIPIIGTKIGNLGTVVSNDEHITNLSEDERNRVQKHYEIRADFYCKAMQRYILKNRDDYPELDESECYRIKDNLHSAASTGVWLGGYRGRIIRK